MQHLQPNTTLQGGKYRIVRVLGQGGFGITYLATDIALDKQVAIKEFFPKDYCDRNESTSHMTLGTASAADLVLKLKAKFLKEVRNIAKLDHPSIIKIHAAFEENNTAYYVMDYIEGENLSDMVQRSGSLPAERALYYMEKVGEALQYIHDRNINHLDIKPANIMVRQESDCPILIDFGLSKQYDSEGQQTSTTPTGISHGYAPIEQYNDGGVKEFFPQTDIYSLAATLYFLLSGMTPPQATRLIDEEFAFPPSIPASLIAPISKAMATSRKQRYDAVGKFIGELTASEDTIIEPISSTKSPNPPQIKINKRLYNGYINGHEWVDLGLPNSVKWATCNVGASSPSDYGNCYAWGETTTKTSTIRRWKIRWKMMTKSLGDISGNPQYDAARANWGGSWRLPTATELEELEDECTWIWTNQGGHNGYKVTGPNGNSIFIPTTDWCFKTFLVNSLLNLLFWPVRLYFRRKKGFYLSSTPYESNFWYGARYTYLEFDSGDYGIYYGDNRFYGFPVRPVTD